MSEVTVRRARPEDGEAVCALVEELLAYERIGPMTEGAHERLVRDLFAPGTPLTAFVAERDGRLVGYAIVYETYSTKRARPRLFIEDIFVQPDVRGRGAGFALFREVVRHAIARGCVQLEWQVLTWNRLALDFYERLGGERDTEWRTYRLGEDGMRALLEG
jgi:GNAT superfamily N-acetyltransferase